MVAPFVNTLRLRLVKVENGGPAAARNRGLEIVRGEIVAFTDDDCCPQPGWLPALAAGVRASPPCAVGGTTTVGPALGHCAGAAHLVLLLLSRYDRSVTGRERLLPANNFAFPVTALIKIGGFNEDFRTAEDRELCRRWAAAGFSLERVSAAVVEHHQQVTLLGFIRKFFAYGQGAASFHGSAPTSNARASLWDSMRFHFRLPFLALRELSGVGLARGVAMIALLILWEISNTAGFLAQWLHGTRQHAAKFSPRTETP